MATYSSTLQKILDDIANISSTPTTDTSEALMLMAAAYNKLITTTPAAYPGSYGAKNTVLYSHVNASGYPDFIEIGTGLACNLVLNSLPLIVSFSAGFDTTEGEVNQKAIITSNITGAWSSLTANTTCYLYIDRASNGTISYGHTIVKPDYRFVKNASTSDGLHNFIIPEGKMWHYSISSWVERQRVFVGEAITGASSVTSVLIYPLCKNWFGYEKITKQLTLTDASTITWNTALSKMATVTIGATGRTLNMQFWTPGIYSLNVVQDGAGSRTITTYNAYSPTATITIKWAGGSAPTLTTTLNKTDVLTFIYDGTNVLADARLNF